MSTGSGEVKPDDVALDAESGHRDVAAVCVARAVDHRHPLARQLGLHGPGLDGRVHALAAQLLGQPGGIGLRVHDADLGLRARVG